MAEMVKGAFFPQPLRDGWLDPEDLPATELASLWHYGPVLEVAEAWGIRLRVRALTSLPGAWLVQGWTEDASAGFGFGLWTARSFTELDGTGVSLYEVCEEQGLELTDDTILEYSALFSRFVHAEEGPFWLVFSVDDLNASVAPGSSDAPTESEQPPLAYAAISDEDLRGLIEPPIIESGDSRWSVECCLQYGDDLARGRFGVQADGAMEMLEDRPLVTGIPAIAANNAPPRSLGLGSRRARGLEPLVDKPLPEMDETTRRMLEGVGIGTTPPSRAPNERGRERSILWECLRLQLLDSLRRGDAAPLYAVDASLGDDELLADFAGFLARSWPALVLETPHYGGEVTVASMLAELMDPAPGKRYVQQEVSGEPDVIGIPPVDSGDLLTLSFHDVRKMVRPEAAAFHLAATENLTVIGCHTLRDLPPALQRLADIVLSLGSPEPSLLRALFRRVFGCDWPEEVDADPMWLRYVEPRDLERPLRDRQDRGEHWRPEEAVASIRERVERRLASVGAGEAPALEELHGMDAARAVVRDVIADFRDAVAGELDWDQVDRGMLLVGEPGTGKTLLARAAAKAAGVHFISTSAGRWGADATEFYDVIRAIRDVFDEAERYAPSILFIDEIDSLGRRDQMVDRNRQLEMEELNTVLQELQGFRDRQGVFVIAATNHLDRIDPALTRAGRLDQVVFIPRPNRAALAEILDFHLGPYRQQGRVAPDLDLHPLAALAVGCTGADIEAFVRDAARRARKAGEPIDAQHLAAAITRAPREGQATRPLSMAEQERVAWHEAGHALAALLAGHFPVELTMVSIVPRSDGSLGFAGFHSEQHPGLTRAAHYEYLEILLAGRAAEEIRYGADGVSSGAGGESGASDLALATGHVLRLVTALGLYDGDSLRWRGVHERRADIPLIDDLLEQAYGRVRERLAAHRALLEAIAERLLADSEVLADDLSALAARHGLDRPASARGVPSR